MLFRSLSVPVLCALKWKWRRWTWQRFNMFLQCYECSAVLCFKQMLLVFLFNKREKKDFLRCEGLLTIQFSKGKCTLSYSAISLKARSCTDVSKFSSVWVWTPNVATQNPTWLNVSGLSRVQDAGKLKTVSSFCGSCCMLDNWKPLVPEPGFHILNLS